MRAPCKQAPPVTAGLLSGLHVLRPRAPRSPCSSRASAEWNQRDGAVAPRTSRRGAIDAVEPAPVHELELGHVGRMRALGPDPGLRQHRRLRGACGCRRSSSRPTTMQSAARPKSTRLARRPCARPSAGQAPEPEADQVDDQHHRAGIRTRGRRVKRGLEHDCSRPSRRRVAALTARRGDRGPAASSARAAAIVQRSGSSRICVPVRRRGLPC